MSDEVPIKIIRSNRRSITMKMLADSILVVRAPILFPKFLIDKFIRDNAQWIEKSRARNLRKEKKEYKSGETFLFLGQKIILKIGDYKSISLRANELLVPGFMEFRIEKEIKNWFINQAEKVILEQVEKYTKEMEAKHNRVMFSDTQSKWGTCFADNRLQFNWRLVMAPILVINYVVVHELSHTVEKNHGRRFWSKVRMFNPSYRQQIKWLKINGDKLRL